MNSSYFASFYTFGGDLVLYGVAGCKEYVLVLFYRVASLTTNNSNKFQRISEYHIDWRNVFRIIL